MKFIYSVKKEFQEILHDRPMLIVLIVFPIFIMMFMGSSFGSIEIRGLPVGVVGPTNTSFSGMLFADLDESSAFKLINFDSENGAREAFRNGQLRAIIIVPDDFEDTLKKGEGANVRIAIDNSDVALQQAVLAVMTSVVQASSTNITRSYVSAAWDDMYSLNSSAAELASDIDTSRSRMENTQESLRRVRTNMSELNIDGLGSSLDAATKEIGWLQQTFAAYRVSDFANASSGFLYNASFALNESIRITEDTHSRLVSQVGNLNQTASTIQTSILALETLKSLTSDNLVRSTLDINIAGLGALRNNTLQQIADAQAQTQQLEDLNTTLRSTRVSLESYSQNLQNATQSQQMLAQNVSASLSDLNSSFAEARKTVDELKTLFSQINSTSTEIEETMTEALVQIDAVEGLISNLQDTVATQTAKDPEMLAAPLSVSVENQYTTSSFVDFIIPQVIAVSLLFSCFLLASISLVREKTRKTVIRLLMIPGALTNAVIAKIVTITIISIMQVAIILLVATLVFAVKPPVDLLMVGVGTGIAALVLSSIGVLIGFYAKSESAAIQTSLIIAIPMLFLGNIIFSPDLLPAYTQILLQLLPLAHITNIFKVVLITNGDPSTNIVALLSYFLLLAVAMAIILIKRRDVTHYQ